MDHVRLAARPAHPPEQNVIALDKRRQARLEAQKPKRPSPRPAA
jgi:hypothetical protein